MQTSIKQAKIRNQPAIEEIEYQPERNLDKNLMLHQEDTSFITRKENVLIIGTNGCIFSLPKLWQKLYLDKADGSYAKENEYAAKSNLAFCKATIYIPSMWLSLHLRE